MKQRRPQSPQSRKTTTMSRLNTLRPLLAALLLALGCDDEARTTAAEIIAHDQLKPADAFGPADLLSPTTPAAALLCDVWTQTGCSTGEKCVAYTSNHADPWGSTKCVQLAPVLRHAGDTCQVQLYPDSGIDNCDKSSVCWFVDPNTNSGVCVNRPKGTPGSLVCYPQGTVPYQFGSNLALCLGSSCDPLLEDCPNSDVCIPHPSEEMFYCVLDASGDVGDLYTPCEYANACDSGYLCLGADLDPNCDPQASGCCLPYCDTANPSCASPGTTCQQIFPSVPEVGVCIL